TVPISTPCTRDELMFAPMNAVRRTGEPDVVAAEVDAAGTVESVIVAADFSLEQSTILIVGRENQSVAHKILPVLGGTQPHSHAIRRYRGKGQVIPGVQLA